MSENTTLQSKSHRPTVKVGPRSSHQKKAEIRLSKDGDTIESIIVVCQCGEEITIQCQYQDAA